MNKNRTLFYIFVILVAVYLKPIQTWAQEVAILKYDGGGDWYANPTAVPNLIEYCNQHINTNLKIEPKVVASDDLALYSYPIVFMTGHGNVMFSEKSKENLRSYLEAGGFLHISDNYGMDPYIQTEIKK